MLGEGGRLSADRSVVGADAKTMTMMMMMMMISMGTSPVTVFLKHGQLDLSKASDSISHQLTSIFSEDFQIS